MEYTSIGRNVRVSPRKVRLSADLIRGKNVEDAMNLLAFDKKRGSYELRKVLQSAMSNAMHRGGVDPMELTVKTCFIGEGLKMKRFRPCGRGRAHSYKRRCSHITVVVE